MHGLADGLSLAKMLFSSRGMTSVPRAWVDQMHFFICTQPAVLMDFLSSIKAEQWSKVCEMLRFL